MSKNSNKVLFKRIDLLLGQYNQLIGNCVEVMEDVEQIISDENSNKIQKDEMFSFLINTNDGKDLVRLSTVLAYMLAPQDQGAINEVVDDIFKNNLTYINSMDDLLELFDLKRKITILVELGVIEVSDIKIKGNVHVKKKVFN